MIDYTLKADDFEIAADHNVCQWCIKWSYLALYRHKQKSIVICADCLIKLRNPTRELRTLASYTIEEKIAWFDKMYTEARRQFDELTLSNADKHFVWEDIMSLLAYDKKRFWEIYRSLQNRQT